MKASFPALCHLHFPGESVEYRGARNALLAEEMELRRQIERVAAQRRALPAGGAIPEDYEFEGDGGLVKLSELFASGKDTLAIYSFMYGPLPRIINFAKERGWHRLRLLSTAGNSYDSDYFGDSTGLAADIRVQQEFKAGEEWDMPMLNVFHRDGKTIRHFWGSEILYVPPEPGQEYRHNDALDPLWNMLDLSPAGRGNFHPQLSYA